MIQLQGGHCLLFIYVEHHFLLPPHLYQGKSRDEPAPIVAENSIQAQRRYDMSMLFQLTLGGAE